LVNDDVSKILVLLPEEWNRSKKQYVRLSLGGNTSNEPIWLGQKHDFSTNGNKARVDYSEQDISKLEEAPEDSIVQLRNNKGVYKFRKKNGKWEPVSES
jgi:hypothetical protein